MQIFYKELGLAEGFKVSDQTKYSRIVAGREVSCCSGYALFSSLRKGEIKCWKCGCVADRWIAGKGRGDEVSKPVLNLFATYTPPVSKRNPHPVPRIVMMTRDHIIPKSLGGMDSVANLRPGCEVCNGARGSKMTKADQRFMDAHPELISKERAAKALERAKRVASQSRRDGEQHA